MTRHLSMTLFCRRHLGMAAGLAAAAALTAAALISATADAQDAGPAVGAPPPDFTGVDSNGVSHTLSDYADELVVLEWTNHACPYVRKHYETGTMQALQADATADGVVWLSVISSGPGRQGYVSADEANALTVSRGASPSAVILDPVGDIGHLYDARTTPQMFVVDHGVVAYMGAIDDRATANHADVDVAVPYVRDALAAIAAGQEVAVSETRSYGCSVKYDS